MKDVVSFELPEELWIKIFRLVDRGALPSTILACRSFKRLARPALYGTLAFKDVTVAQACCKSILTIGEDLGRLVRSFRLFRDKMSVNPPLETCHRTGVLLVSCLEIMTQLKSFSCLDTPSIVRPRVILTLCAMPTLERLELVLSPEFDDGQFENICRAPPAPPVLLENLKYLRFSHRHSPWIWPAEMYDKVLSILTAAPALENVVVSGDEKFTHKVLQSLSVANAASPLELKSVVLPDVSSTVLSTLRQLPRLRAVAFFSRGFSRVELVFRDGPPLELEQLRCSARTFLACSSHLTGLAFLQLDGTAYP